MPRANRQRSNYRNHPATRPQEGARTRHPTPQFIKERRVVNYDHLPRPFASTYPDGTMSDRIGWTLLHPDLHNHVRLRTAEIPSADVYIELYRSLGKIAILQNKVVNHIWVSAITNKDRDKALTAARAVSTETISAAMNLMDQILSTGRWAHALWDLLPYRDQHNANATRQPLPEPARLTTGPISPHEGPSSNQVKPTLTLVTVPLGNHFLSEAEASQPMQEPSPMITEHDHKEQKEAEEMNEEERLEIETMQKEMTDRLERELQKDEGPNRSPNSSSEEDWETYIAELLARRSDSSNSPDSSPSTSPATTTYGSSPSVASSWKGHHVIAPVYTCFKMGDRGHLIANAPHPWKLMRLTPAPDLSIILVHPREFPQQWSSQRIHDTLLHAMPDLRDRPKALERAHLMVEDSLARWANIPAVLLNAETSKCRLNLPYRLCLGEDPQEAAKWDAIRTTYSAEVIVTATVQFIASLIKGQDWDNHWVHKHVHIHDDLEPLFTLAQDIDNLLDRDQKEPGPLAALNMLDYWIIRRSDYQMMILENPSKFLDMLVYSFTSPQPARRLFALCNLNHTQPDDEHWKKHTQSIINYRSYIKDVGLKDKGSMIWNEV